MQQSFLKKMGWGEDMVPKPGVTEPPIACTTFEVILGHCAFIDRYFKTLNASN